jgi:uncharacterized damage-inducible protein DinB
MTLDFLKEIEAETGSARKCLEHIPADKFGFKPHPTSMEMRYLALLVAEIPLWITYMLEKGEVDFADFPHPEIRETNDLLKYLDDNMEGVRKAMQNATEEQLSRTFYLKSHGKELFSAKVSEYIGPTINHWVHHRGQLTVYMRICEISVPSIYGPSGDVKEY